MSYRPITDIWMLARCKYKGGIKRYGGYLGGFPERARALLGCTINEPVLHVCGGMAKHYPYKRGFGPYDMTMDLDPETEPDILHDVRKPFPNITVPESLKTKEEYTYLDEKGLTGVRRLISNWQPKACLCDPPYSEQDAAHYNVGSNAYPKPNEIIKNCFDILPVGGRVGIIHYIIPKAPKNSVFVACVGVVCGFNNRMRAYTVFEKT